MLPVLKASYILRLTTVTEMTQNSAQSLEQNKLINTSH